MTTDRRIFDHLADLFSYPEAESLFHLERVEGLLQERQDLLQGLAPFAEFVRHSAIHELEECFTQTFDLNTNNCLEVGWHLFGEDYKRGQFLVRMRSALAEHGIAESVELPDHLSHCLRLLSRLDDEDSQLFVENYLGPAVGRIARGMRETDAFKGPIDVLWRLVSEVGRLSGAEEPSRPSQSSFELPVLNGIC